MKWFDNQHHNKVNTTTLPFELHRVSDTVYDEIIKRGDEYFLIKRCGVMPYTGVHGFTEFVTDGCTLVYPLPRSQQTETKIDWTPPKTQGDFTTFVINSGGVQPEIEAKLAIDRRYKEWREDKEGQTIVVAPFNVDYKRHVYVDKIYGNKEPVGELVVDEEGQESYELAINTVEFPSLKTYDGVTHISSQGETLSPHMKIETKQLVDGQEVLSSFEGKNITVDNAIDGEVESAILYGETYVNAIKEPRQEVILPYEFEDGESITIENTKVSGSLDGLVLKGQTLINHCPDSIYVSTGWSTGMYNQFDNFPTLVKGRVYTIYAPIADKTGNAGDSAVGLTVSTDGQNQSLYGTWGNGHGTILKTFTMGDRLWFNNYAITGERFAQNYPQVMILEGEWTLDTLPQYFRGMGSSKMPVLTTYTNLFPGFITKGYIGSDGKHYGIDGDLNYLSDFIEITNNKLSFRAFSSRGVALNVFGEFAFYDENKTFIGYKYGPADEVVEAPINTKYIRVWAVDRSNPTDNVKGMLIYSDEKPSNIATYEPYKTNILSCNEDVTLRSIDNVEDSLELDTGKLTQYIGETIFNGSENWYLTSNENDTTIRFGLAFPNAKPTTLMCDTYIVEHTYDKEYECIQLTDANVIVLRISKNKATNVDELKSYLQSNPFTVQYLLKSPTTKTVELNIVNQDGVKQDKLQTFDGITYLTTSAQEGSLNPIISSNFEIPVNIKANTQYSIIKDSTLNGHDDTPFTLDLGGTTVETQVGEKVTLITTPQTLTHNSLKPSGWGQKLSNLMVIEGDLTDVDIPYIEGMKSVSNPSVLSTGKNVFNSNIRISQSVSSPHMVMETPTPNSVRVALLQGEEAWRAGFFKVQLEPNTWYKARCSAEGYGQKEISFIIPDLNGAWNPDTRSCSETTDFLGHFRTRESGTVELRFSGSGAEKSQFDILYKDIQIEKVESSSVTHSDYEPHKSNILSTPEDLVLRRVGETKDVLDMKSGILTQSVFEIELNRASMVHYNGKTGELANFDINPSHVGLPLVQKYTHCVTHNLHDNITFRASSSFLKLELCFNSELPSSSSLTQIIDYLDKLLQSSPIKVQYIAETPVEKTVVIGNGEDLSLDETRIKLPRPLEENEVLEWNSSNNHYQIIGYENGVKKTVEDCKDLINRYMIPLRDKIKTYVTSKASKLLLNVPYRKVRELTVPENFTVVLDNENDLITATWDSVVGATDYDIFLEGQFLTRVSTNQYQRSEEIKGHLKVRAVNDLTMSDFTDETYVLSVPNETFISLVENKYEEGHVFTVTFADYSNIETGFRVRWSPDGREEQFADIAGVQDTGTVLKHTFAVPLIQDYIDIRVNSYNDTGENPIVPPIHLEMSPTPIWTYKEALGQVMLQWNHTIEGAEHYVLKYKVDGAEDYVYETILTDGYDTLAGYIELGKDETAEVSVAGVVNGLAHVFCKPFMVGKALDESLLPPQGFTYRKISENEFEFSWTDSYTCEREFELILSHSDGRVERIIVPSTSSSTTGRKYTYRYTLENYGYFGVKLRMNWELGSSNTTEEYTIYYLPTVVEPPAYIRKERRETEVSLQWEAQAYVDYYALYLSIDGNESEYSVKNNHYEFKIDFEKEPEIQAYIRTHFLDGKVSSSSTVLQFKPCYSPNHYMTIMTNIIEEEKVLDCNITSPEIETDYVLHTGSISTTEVAYPVSMSSITKFTMAEFPMTTDFWGRALETEGQVVNYVCRSGLEQSRYPVNVLTYKPTENNIPIFETTVLNYTYEAPITTEVNPVRITTIGDSITAGHPNYWAETGTGDVRSQYQYWLNRKLNGQYEIINKGYGSDTTDKMVARFDKDVLETYPQYCIIQGGTNDLYWAMAESSGDQVALDRKLEVMKSNIIQMVQKCIANNIIPIVGTLIPRTGATGIYQKALFDFNDWIIQYCNELETAYYVDFFNAGKNNIPPTPLEDPTNRGALNPIYDGDAIYDEYGNLIKQGRGIHPNIEGYKIMADSIPTSIFQAQDSGVKLYLDSACTREEEFDNSDKMNPFYTISIDGLRRGKAKTFVRYVKNVGVGQVLYAMYYTGTHNINVRFVNEKGEYREFGNGSLPSGHSHAVYIEVTPLTHDSVSKIDLHLAGRELKTKS